jgi:hypothetical protein
VKKVKRKKHHILVAALRLMLDAVVHGDSIQVRHNGTTTQNSEGSQSVETKLAY